MRSSFMQPFERILNGAFGAFIACVLYPQFGRDEKLLSGHAAIPERATNGFFIQVGGGSINQSISSLNGIPHGALALRELPKLKNAKSKSWHFDAIVQSEFIHALTLICKCVLIARRSSIPR